MARQSANMDGKYIIYIPGIYCTVGWTDLIILETQNQQNWFWPFKEKTKIILRFSSFLDKKNNRRHSPMPHA